MLTNRISQYFEEQAPVQAKVAVGQEAFVFCPMGMMTGDWARAVYQRAWEKAAAEVGMGERVQAKRSLFAAQPSWN